MTQNATVSRYKIVGIELSLILQIFSSHFLAFGFENDKHPCEIWG